jgi:hypothetical protein
MAAQFDLSRLNVRQFAERFRDEMIPLSNTFSYFCASLPMTEEDLKEYLQEPVAALPSQIASSLPKISILLVPYLEKSNGREKTRADYVAMERPPDNRLSTATQFRLGEEAVMCFALKDQDVAEVHYRFYGHIATLVGDAVYADEGSEAASSRYTRLLREELSANAHGEVDDAGWRLKQALVRRPVGSRNGKAFRDYARQSFIDTLTLYLHGICCDIDVEMGPRQLPSRYLRKRLKLLQELFPQPTGYAVFPEELNR